MGFFDEVFGELSSKLLGVNPAVYVFTVYPLYRLWTAGFPYTDGVFKDELSREEKYIRQVLSRYTGERDVDLDIRFTGKRFLGIHTYKPLRSRRILVIPSYALEYLDEEHVVAWGKWYIDMLSSKSTYISSWLYRNMGSLVSVVVAPMFLLPSIDDPLLMSGNTFVYAYLLVKPYIKEYWLYHADRIYVERHSTYTITKFIEALVSTLLIRTVENIYIASEDIAYIGVDSIDVRKEVVNEIVDNNGRIEIDGIYRLYSDDEVLGANKDIIRRINFLRGGRIYGEIQIPMKTLEKLRRNIQKYGLEIVE